MAPSGKDHNGNDDHNHHHGEGCGHSSIDDNLNYPFHYHYEAQKLRGDGKNNRTPLMLPPFIQNSAEAEGPLKNSLIAIENLKELKINAIYLDCTITGDDEAVISNATQLFEVEDILTLEDALETLIDLNIGALLHIRAVKGEEKSTTGVILDTISRIWDETCPPLALVSEYPICLSLVNEIMPSLPIIYALEDWQKETSFPHLKEEIENLVPSALLIHEKGLTEEMIDQILEHNLPLITATYSDPLQGKRLLRWGVDHLLSIDSALLKENLA